MFRVVYDYNYQQGKHQFIIEKYGETFQSRLNKIFSIFPKKSVMGWERYGGGYYFDDKETALKECSNLNAGKIIVEPT